MVNCNPETVSTDYDTTDRLYFEPLTLEDVLEIVEREKPLGRDRAVRRADAAASSRCRSSSAGVPILGTSPDAIDRAEDRERFDAVLEKLGLRGRRAASRAAPRKRERGRRADRLPGAGAAVLRARRARDGDRATTSSALRELHARRGARPRPSTRCWSTTSSPTPSRSTSTRSATASACVIGGIMEHIEEAGIHSGDCACSLPPYSLRARR